jgi:hypothetical protein
MRASSEADPKITNEGKGRGVFITPRINGDAPIPVGGSYTLNISAQAIAEPDPLTLLGVGVAALMGYLTWCRRKMAVPLRG